MTARRYWFARMGRARGTLALTPGSNALLRGGLVAIWPVSDEGWLLGLAQIVTLVGGFGVTWLASRTGNVALTVAPMVVALAVATALGFFAFTRADMSHTVEDYEAERVK